VAKSEARIDWSRSSEELDRLVRAFNPAPGAEAAVGTEVLKIWKARPAEGRGTPGEMLEAEGGHFVVATGSGALTLLEVQKPGGRRVSADEFLRGARLHRGAALDR
jgi:methionyl-tRNA formyltransferase